MIPPEVVRMRVSSTVLGAYMQPPKQSHFEIPTGGNVVGLIRKIQRLGLSRSITSKLFKII